MAGASIDVALPPKIQEFLARPRCLELPKPGKAQITLPTGGRIKGLADVTKAFPDDCTLSFSLALQLGPILANLDCLLKLVKLIKPAIDLVDALTSLNPAKIAGAVPEFAKAVPPVVECIAQFFAGIPLFVKDILCLIIKILKCLLGQLKSIAALMGGLALEIKAATAEGNTELLEELKCAQENATNSAAGVVSAIEPVTLILSLAEPFLGIAGVDPIKIPSFASPADVDSLNQAITALDGVLKALELAADALPGGCS